MLPMLLAILYVTIDITSIHVSSFSANNWIATLMFTFSIISIQFGTHQKLPSPGKVAQWASHGLVRRKLNGQSVIIKMCLDTMGVLLQFGPTLAERPLSTRSLLRFVYTAYYINRTLCSHAEPEWLLSNLIVPVRI